VLQKDVDPRQRLLRAIAVKSNVEKVKFASGKSLKFCCIIDKSYTLAKLLGFCDPGAEHYEFGTY
jgi:hypothetical protein